MTTLSIVTVVRNDLPGLQRTADSLDAQTLSDFEWVVIDGASREEHQPSREALSPTPAVLLSEPDQGIYDAMNKGWRNASGEWILFLNAGDTLCQARTLEDVIPELRRTSARWAFGVVRNVDAEGKVIGLQNASPFNRMGHALGNTTVPHQATFMRRELLDSLGGFDSRFGMAADQEAIYRAALEGEPAELVWPIANFPLNGRGMQVPVSAHVRAMRKARREHNDQYLGNAVTDAAATAALMMSRATAPWFGRLRN